MKKIAFLLLIYLGLHLLIIGLPKTYVFDEYWYVPSAKRIIQDGVDLRPEHPPLAQVLIAMGITLFGDNPLGWRIFSVFFGVLSILALYLLVKEISKNEWTAFMSATLLSFEKMFFTFSSLALLDVFFIFFMILSFHFFFKNDSTRSALAAGLGAVCKLNAVLAAPVLILYHIFDRFSLSIRTWVKSIRWMKIVIWISVFLASFLVFLFLFDQVYTGPDLQMFSNPVNHLKYMLEIHSSKYWSRSDEPGPWAWIYSPRNYYYGNLSVARVPFLEVFNPFVTGLSLVSVPYAIYNLKRTKDRLSLFALIWFSVTYFIWFPSYFIFSHPLFSFYILATIPSICILNTIFFQNDRRVAQSIAMMAAAYFLFFQYPIRILF